MSGSQGFAEQNPGATVIHPPACRPAHSPPLPQVRSGLGGPGSGGGWGVGKSILPNTWDAASAPLSGPGLRLRPPHPRPVHPQTSRLPYS